jgi:hypothetical protein
MGRVLWILALWALLAGAPGGASQGEGAARPPAAEPLRLDVLQGWAVVLEPDRRQFVTRADGPQTLVRGCYLELGSSAAVELSWSGSASIRLQGPSGAFVEPGTDPAQGRALGFRRVGQAEFELRRGPLAITLPRGQRLLPGNSAFRLEGQVGGLVDLEHRAGEPLELDIGSRYTFPLPAGTRRRLPECVAPPLPTSQWTALPTWTPPAAALTPVPPSTSAASRRDP